VITNPTATADSTTCTNISFLIARVYKNQPAAREPSIIDR